MYLLLVLGYNRMVKAGLSKCIPRRKCRSNSQSLASPANKDMSNWDFSCVKFSDKDKTEMIAQMVQIMILLMCSTTCYKFGGQIFRQKGGLGIGLRGSAAIARLSMCTWDGLWARLMLAAGISLNLFYRYVDDIRVYMRPLLKGWTWQHDRWVFDPSKQDDRDAHTRTVQEMGKSLNSVWEFLKFTTEDESEFDDHFLPTLDFSTKVGPSGYINYKFFSKPMSSNTLLMFGTALSRSCVFSSLRQELVRMLLNTDHASGEMYRLEIVNKFIQLAVNSGHKFSYIKALVLQGLSKYTYMVQRNSLPSDDPKYSPIHRSRSFDEERRKLLKYTNGGTWYTGSKLGDRFKDHWKHWITSKEQWWRRQPAEKEWSGLWEEYYQDT